MEQKLETFLTLCQTLHYGRAAERLHLSQPAVSKQIQSLEAYYGVRLFRYDGRKLSKTPQGELLERYAISLRYNDAELLRALHAAPKTRLRIGATKSIGDYILLPEICRFLRDPAHELDLLVDNTAHLLSMLDAGELDFAVLEGIFDKRQYDSFLFRPEPYIGVCAAGIRSRGARFPFRSCLTNVSFCASPAPAPEKFWNANCHSLAIPLKCSAPPSASAA